MARTESAGGKRGWTASVESTVGLSIARVHFLPVSLQTARVNSPKAALTPSGGPPPSKTQDGFNQGDLAFPAGGTSMQRMSVFVSSVC